MPEPQLTSPRQHRTARLALQGILAFAVRRYRSLTLAASMRRPVMSSPISRSGVAGAKPPAGSGAAAPCTLLAVFWPVIKAGV